MAQGISIHMGLNRVDPACYDGVWTGELVGAVQDAQDMYAIAVSQGFQATLLLQEAVTRTAVTQAIYQASAMLSAGDILMVSYAGHGGIMRDLSCDEADDQDETWCLYDGHLLDDELYLLWHSFAAGVRILVISDSCHSGTITRASIGMPRAMPKKVALATWQKQRDFYLNLVCSDESAETLQASVRLISASADGDFAYDGVYDGTPNGFFTSKLKQVWNEGAFCGNYPQFFNQLYDAMYCFQPPQYSVLGLPDAAYDQQHPFQIG
jgi:hypothetical protein